MRTSAATAPSVLREDRIQIEFAESRENRLTRCDTATMIARERRAVDRGARRARRAGSRPPRSRRSSRAHRLRLAGARRKVTSLSTSTSTPPRPKATTLPKLGSVSGADDHLLAAGEHLLDLHAADFARRPCRRVALRDNRFVGPLGLGRALARRPSRRPLRSCAGCRARRFSSRPESRASPARAAGLGGGRRGRGLGQRDCAGLAERPAFGGRKRDFAGPPLPPR